MKLLLSLLAVCLLASVNSGASAQTPALATLGPTLTMPNCAKPVTNGKVDTDEAADLFFKQLNDYKICMAKYIDVLRKQAAPYTDAALATNKEFAAYVASSPAVAAALAPPPVPASKAPARK